MKRFLFLLIATLFLFNVNTFAEENNKYEFVRDYIKGLGLVKSSFVDGTTAFNGTYSNEVEKGVAIMKSAQSQLYALSMAENYLKGYQNSTDKLINEVVKNALYSYNILEEINKQSTEGYKRMYSPEVLNNPSQFNQGEEMDKIGKLQATQEQALELLIDSSKIAPAVLISRVPGEEGKMNYLTITLEQKNELLEDLLNDFGNKLRVDKKDLKNSGLATIDLSGWVIYHTLSEPYKTFEDRPKDFKEPME